MTDGKPASARLAIDVTAGVNQAAGIGRVTRETVEALAARTDAPRMTLFYARERGVVADGGVAWIRDLVGRRPSVRVRRVPVPPRWTTYFWLRGRLPLPVEVIVGSVDLMLAPDFVAPPAARARTIVTVHDLSFLTVPQHADPALRRYLTAAVPASLRRATHVIAVSDATRRDILARYQLPADRVTTVYNGVNARFRPVNVAERAAARARLGLPARSIVTLGTIEPRKNHLGLLRAFHQLAADFPDVALVVGGRRGWLDQPFFDEIAHLGLTDRVRLLGPVPDADLPSLYCAATVFAFPSWYEGFGLPPLEALACGTPVVASASSSLPEVCGDAALLVDPADIGSLAGALRRVLTDAALRDDLAARGPARAARFRWSATADSLLAVLARVLAGDG